MGWAGLGWTELSSVGFVEYVRAWSGGKSGDLCRSVD